MEIITPQKITLPVVCLYNKIKIHLFNLRFDKKDGSIYIDSNFKEKNVTDCDIKHNFSRHYNGLTSLKGNQTTKRNFLQKKNEAVEICFKIPLSKLKKSEYKDANKPSFIINIDDAINNHLNKIAPCNDSLLICSVIISPIKSDGNGILLLTMPAKKGEIPYNSQIIKYDFPELYVSFNNKICANISPKNKLYGQTSGLLIHKLNEQDQNYIKNIELTEPLSNENIELLGHITPCIFAGGQILFNPKNQMFTIIHKEYMVKLPVVTSASKNNKYSLNQIGTNKNNFSQFQVMHKKTRTIFDDIAAPDQELWTLLNSLQFDSR